MKHICNIKNYVGDNKSRAFMSLFNEIYKNKKDLFFKMHYKDHKVEYSIVDDNKLRAFMSLLNKIYKNKKDLFFKMHYKDHKVEYSIEDKDFIIFKSNSLMEVNDFLKGYYEEGR